MARAYVAAIGQSKLAKNWLKAAIAEPIMKAKKNEFGFVTDAGEVLDDADAILAITRLSDGLIKPIGTGLFISPNGLFVTAKHVIEEFVDRDGRPADGLAAFHFKDGGYSFRSILRAHNHPHADISVGVLQPMHHRSTRQLLSSKCLKMDFSEQAVGSHIGTWTFQEARHEVHEKKQSLHFRNHFFSGHISAYHKNGRDRYLMNWPCYEGNLLIKGGASGGPVFNVGTGRAFAVNSTSFEGANISYYTPLSLIQELSVADVTLGGK